MFRVFINDEEVTVENDFPVQQEILNVSNVVLKKVRPKSWEDTDKLLTDIYFPEDFSRCKITYNDELYFVGIVRASGDIDLKIGTPKYIDLQVIDYKTFLSEGNALEIVISDKTIYEAIELVVREVSSYGFVVGNIELDDIDTAIGAYSTFEQSAFDVFQYFAEITQSLWFTRIIDENTIAIDFYSKDKLPVGIELIHSPEFYKENGIIDIKPSFSTNDYRNKQIVKSERVYADIDYIEVPTITSSVSNFITDQPIGILKRITVNGADKTFTTNTYKSLGMTADFYYTPTEQEIASEEVYQEGTNITFTYTPLVKGREVVYNNDEISRISTLTNRSGTIARYENRNDTLSASELREIGSSYLKYKGKAEVTLKVVTKNNDIFEIGQSIHFNINHKLLNDDYLVKTKNSTITDTGKEVYIEYEYELSNTYNMEKEINFFDNQLIKATGNLEEGSFITRNIDINNTANIIFDNLVVEKIGTTGDNVLNSILNSPFVD